MSNTKLTADSKQTLKEFKKNNPDIRFFNNGVVTVCVVPEFNNSKMVQVSVSIMSEDEIKFRAKVGEYIAMSRMEQMENITVPRTFDVYSFMDTIA